MVGRETFNEADYGDFIYMLKQKLLVGFAVMAALFLGVHANSFAYAKKGKKVATFKVRIENISNADGIAGQDGVKYPFAISPGLFVVTDKNTDFFKAGKRATDALEAQAEDGNPELLSKKLLTKVGSLYMGVFNKPAGSDMPAPLLPNGVFEFNFTATEGMKLNLVSMFGQSNDLFYAPTEAIDLFVNGEAISGDITDSLALWDAGTEVNQAPGVGDEQAPRQKMANTGKAENGVVQMVKDGFSYPNTKDVLRVTITAQ